MNRIAISIAASALVLGASLASFAGAQPPRQPITIEGRDHPILLGRMVVSATPLPAR